LIPNPALESVSLQFELQQADHLQLEISNSPGQLLKTASYNLDAGKHSIILNRSDIGIYGNNNLVLIRLHGAHHRFVSKLLFK
ncbi:MAG: hypothetical protein AB7D35_12670, partial [Bacteroidales bacterium]